MSNPLARAILQGRPGVWLLDLDLGGEILRVSTEPVVIESADGEVRYGGGLTDFDLAFTVDKVSVKVQQQRESWSVMRRRLGPFRGRVFRLRRWFEGLPLEDAYLALEGVVASATYASPSAPLQLSATLSRDARALSYDYPLASMAVGSESWDTDYDEEVDGEPYPIVIGAPGSRSNNLSATTPPLQVTPGLYVRNRTLTKLVLIAGHHVEAENVRLFNRTTGDSLNATPINTFDELGQPVAVIETFGLMATRDLQYQDELLIGWDGRRTGWGHALTHSGRPVTGLGDLLVWGAETLTIATWDREALQANRSALNRYKVDTYWNEPMLWEDWVQANVLGVFPVEEVQGPRGRYYREIRYEVSRHSVIAHLATRGSGAGRRVERKTPLVEAGTPVVNQLTLYYGGYSTKDWHRYSRVVGARKGSSQSGIAGAATLETFGADHLAAVSDTLYDTRAEVIKAPQVHDDATAALLMRWHLHTRALPWRSATYVAGPDCAELRVGDQVVLNDTSFGANVIDEIAVVRELVWTERGVELDLTIPEDLIESPTYATSGKVAAAGVCTRPAGTWTLVQSLHGAALSDVNGLDAGGTTFDPYSGLFTFDRNSTKVNSDGFNEDPMYYAIPVGGTGNLLPEWDESVEDLEVFVAVADPFTAGTHEGFAVALVDGNTSGSLQGVGFACRYRQGGGRIDVCRQSGTTNGLILTLTTGTELYGMFGSFHVAETGEVYMTTLFTEDGAALVNHQTYNPQGVASATLASGQRYLLVQSGSTGGGSGGVATSGQCKVHVRRVLRGSYE